MSVLTIVLTWLALAIPVTVEAMQARRALEDRLVRERHPSVSGVAIAFRTQVFMVYVLFGRAPLLARLPILLELVAAGAWLAYLVRLPPPKEAMRRAARRALLDEIEHFAELETSRLAARGVTIRSARSPHHRDNPSASIALDRLPHATADLTVWASGEAELGVAWGQVAGGWQRQVTEHTELAGVPDVQRALDYDLESVRWADGYIGRCRDAGMFRDPGTREGFVTAFGAFLGECLVRVYGGAWVATREGVFGVRLDETFIVFPFGKVSKFLDDDADSIASFFEVLPQFPQIKRDPEGHNVRVIRGTGTRGDA